MFELRLGGTIADYDRIKYLKGFLGWIEKPWAQEYVNSPRAALIGIGVMFILLPLLFQALSIPNPITVWLQAFTETLMKLLL